MFKLYGKRPRCLWCGKANKKNYRGIVITIKKATPPQEEVVVCFYHRNVAVRHDFCHLSFCDSSGNKNIWVTERNVFRPHKWNCIFIIGNSFNL